MTTNTSILEAMVDSADDKGRDTEFFWDQRYEGVLFGVEIDGKWIANDDYDYEVEVAKEIAEMYYGDDRSARAYYYG